MKTIFDEDQVRLLKNPFPNGAARSPDAVVVSER